MSDMFCFQCQQTAGNKCCVNTGVCGKQPVLDLITRKPLLPSAEEIERNPRSRSAKLRVARKR